MGAIAEKKKTKAITAEVIEEEHPGVYAQIFNLGKQEAAGDLDTAVGEALEKGKGLGKAEGSVMGAADEVERIKAVMAQSVPGQEDLIKALAFDGKTTGGEAAQAVIAAENDKRKKMLATMQEESEESIDNDHEGELQEAGKDKGFKALVTAHMEAKSCTKGEAIFAMAKEHPVAHKEYVASMSKTKA